LETANDHCQIEFSVYVDASDVLDDNNAASKYYYDWQNADFVGMEQILINTNWHDDVLAFNLTADSLWTAFREIVQPAIHKFVNKKFLMSGSSRKLVLAPGIKRAVARTRCVWRQSTNSTPNDSALEEAYRRAVIK